MHTDLTGIVILIGGYCIVYNLFLHTFDRNNWLGGAGHHLSILQVGFVFIYTNPAAPFGRLVL
jgi:hypothetical protein